MTSIAYKQYCNISYNGGSYVCSPIKGPLSTSQTPGTIENRNRGITHAKNGQPTKEANCDNGNTNAMERKLYKNKILNTKERYEKIKSKYDYGTSDSSFRTSFLKTTAIGKSVFNAENQALSFKSVHVQDINRAKNRVRKSGSAVPRKVQLKVLPPPSTSVETYRSIPNTSHAAEKVSVFMPRHLRSRIGCKEFCDGGEIINNNTKNNNQIGCTNNNIMDADIFTDTPCILSINNIYVFDDFETGEKTVVLNSQAISNYLQSYSVGRGKYLFLDVRLEDAFTILNHNKSDLISIQGDRLKKFTRLVNGINYDFYYGDVQLVVTGDFNIVSIFFYNYGYAGGKYLFNYFETCSDLNGASCLTDPTDIRLVKLENGQHRVAFNGITELYQSQYGLTKGTYLVKNVSIDLAFTIANKDLYDKIFLTCSEEEFPFPVNGEDYIFYYGDVVIHVLEDFNYASIIMYNNNFIGGKYIFKYNDMCTNIVDFKQEGFDDPVETTKKNLPDTIYSQTVNKTYVVGVNYSVEVGNWWNPSFETRTGDGIIAIKKRPNIDTSMFVKYVVSPDGPQFPDWLTIDPLTGDISGIAKNDDDAFYVIEFKIRAMLSDNTYKDYSVSIVVFNMIIQNVEANDPFAPP